MSRGLVATLLAAAVLSTSAVAQSPKSVWTGVYSAAQAKTGAELYFSTCVDCHGDDLEGRERAPALAGSAFSQRWDGASLAKLFDRIEQMPPDKPDARLAAAQCVDVLAFLLSANNIPAGTQRLDADKNALAGITYTSQPPKF